nr:MAG TPA: hypothetical protein [Ackermannviridae sp.]
MLKIPMTRRYLLKYSVYRTYDINLRMCVYIIY